MAFSFPQPPPQQQSIFQSPSQPSFQFQPTNPFLSQQQQQQMPQPQPQPQQSPFQFQPQQQQQQSFFQPQQQQQQQQQQHSFFQPQQPQQQQILLYTVDKAPASYNTKWADLHPDSQKYLILIEEKILEYRAESLALDQCSRLYDSSVANYGFELDASRILQELGGTATAMDRERVLIQERMAAVNIMIRETEIAVRSFMMIRQRFLHRHTGANAISGSQPIGTTAAPTPNAQSLASSAPVFDFYSGLPRRPSMFMQNTVARFEKYLAECYQWVGELEQMLNLTADGKINSGLSSLQSLPSVMSNVHDFFVHVAAKVENLHQRVESMKIAYLADQRRQGDWNDPFLEADRRAIAKQEAAARRVHPTLHLLSAAPQPTTQSAGLAASSTIAGSASVPQLTSGTSGSSSASSFSLFGNPSSSAQTSIFSTPISAASMPSLFGGSTGSFPQPTPFTAASAPSSASSQPSSLFGPSTTLFASPGFGSSPAFSTPSFSTPSFATGAATGSGFSFGGTSASKPSKPKSRTSRR